MVEMMVRGDHEVDPVDAVPREVSLEQRGARSPIDERASPVARDDERGIALADIEEAEFDARGVRTRAPSGRGLRPGEAARHGEREGDTLEERRMTSHVPNLRHRTVMRPVALRLLNLAVFLGVLYGNFVAASGGLSGRNIGEIANAYPSRFLPANWVFGIWSLIYAGLFVALAYQLWPGDRGRRAVERLGPWWTVLGVLNVAWIALFSFARYREAMGVMLVFLVALIATGERLRRDPSPDRWDRLCLVAPHDLYLAWIAVAVIANAFQLAHVVGFGGFGLPERAWALGMMGVATGLGWWMAWARRNLTFPFVVAWALAGIAARYPADGAVVWAGGPGAVGGIIIGSALWVAATRRTSTQSSS